MSAIVHDDDARAREALRFLSSDCDRDTWVRIGAALKSGLGDAGFGPWDDWSREAVDRYDPAAARATWKSLRAEGGITIATLFAEAKKAGYVPRLNGHTVSPSPIDRAKRDEEQRKADEETKTKHERAAAKALAVWRAAKIGEHSYLERKGVRATATAKVISIAELVKIIGYEPAAGGDKLRGQILCLPIVVDGAPSSMEMVDEDGRKSALAGGRKAAGYWPTRQLPPGDGEGAVFYIGEGAATVLSAVEGADAIGIAAFGAHNLKAVALAFRVRCPKAKIIVLADVGNGEDQAHEAAAAVGGLVATPDFGPDRPEGAKDFNDLARLHGAPAVQACVGRAQAPQSPSSSQPRAENRSRTDSGVARGSARAIFRRFSEIETRAIRWLWPGRIARGKVSMIAGNPGLGKSQATASMAAIVTRGGTWPVDRTPCERGSVIFLSAEDDAEDTIRPRLEAAGADLTRCAILDAIADGYTSSGDEIRRSFNLKTDLARLAEAVAAVGDVAMVVIDPISAYLGGADSHNNAEVRALLAPLSNLAAEHGVAVVAVSHLNKGGNNEALMRVTGSLAFVAAARSAFIVVGDKEAPERRLFLPLKNNLGRDQDGLAFSIQSAALSGPAGRIESSKIVWEGAAVTITADEAMAPALDAEERSELEDAKAFLADLLATGPVPSKRVRSEADGAGHSWATMRRAQQALKVEATKDGMAGPWLWRLPPKMLTKSEDAQPKSVSAFEENERLRRDSCGATDDAEVF